MPLNIEDNDKQQFQEPAKTEPILHTPSAVHHLASRIIGIIFGVIVLAAIGFLVYTYVIVGGRRDQTAGSTQEEPANTAGNSTGPEAASSSQQETSAVSATTLRYTVYIASYRVRGDAEEEVARWHDAGFEASVREYDGWFRVALGAYGHVSDARNKAEELKEAFEQGYWIGPI